MTWPCDLLPLPEGATVDTADCSLDEPGGVLPTVPSTCVDSFLTAAIRGMSFSSTRSSSSPLLIWSSLRFIDASGSDVWDHIPLGSMVTWSMFFDVFASMSLTYLRYRESQQQYNDPQRVQSYSSTSRAAKLTLLLQMGHCQVGACSCNWRNDNASKHWLCVHTVERHGTLIRSVDRGHFKDIIEDVATISLSFPLSITKIGYLAQTEEIVMYRELTLADDLVCWYGLARHEFVNEVLRRMLPNKIYYQIKFLNLVSG